jgi:hypothetical protein
MRRSRKEGPVMAKAAGKLPENKLIARLAELKNSGCAFAGYVGKSGEAGTIRLYMSLSDLSQYLEFPESALLHSIPARSDRDRTFVWLKPDANVRAVIHRPSEGTAQAVAAAIARNQRRSR